MKSPFLIQPDFISPLTCEKIISSIGNTPNFDKLGQPIKWECENRTWEHTIAERFRELEPEIEDRYNCQYKKLEAPLFQVYPENAKVPAEQPGCANSKFVRKRWVVTKNIDLVGYLWLKDFNSSVPIDPRFEVMGGKLEFPAYNFSLVPQRGTLVIFPAGPHFITVISPILVGTLHQVKIHINIKDKSGAQWFYQPQQYPGKWQDWLNEYL